ncbi:hypothetical protein NDU88_006938 [Pleurodeles waltl]|uniref:Uncharacterized protein n=1 Tax=Pleurodeles waltl TaxID=8319 RepID=A0AAV7VR22_PLEWA|nr:hypothetical protein NDU88_006938 [Pleurodeles waltl]
MFLGLRIGWATNWQENCLVYTRVNVCLFGAGVWGHINCTLLQSAQNTFLHRLLTVTQCTATSFWHKEVELTFLKDLVKLQPLLLWTQIWKNSEAHLRRLILKDCLKLDGGGRAQDGGALRRSCLRSAALARESVLRPAWGKPGGCPYIASLPPGVLGSSAPVGAKLRRSPGRSRARPRSLGAAAERRKARPGPQDGPSPRRPLQTGCWGLRAEGPTLGPLISGDRHGTRRLVIGAPEG